MKTINELCDLVRETGFAIHVYHGHGHLEKVYENALTHRLRKAGLDVKQQHPIQVLDKFAIKKYALTLSENKLPLNSMRSLCSFAANTP